MNAGETHLSKRNLTAESGCRLFQVQIPRKALTLLKERHGNVGALIRGLLAEQLGPDWPEDELFVYDGSRIPHARLKVTRSAAKVIVEENGPTTLKKTCERYRASRELN
jgi:hypothetical protein